MARTGLKEVLGLVDPAMNYNWDFIVPNIPGGGDSAGLTIKAAQCNLPGVSLDVVPVTLHGVTVNYAGMERYGHQFQVTYLETRDMGTRRDIRAWIELARNTRNNSGTEKSVYATTATLLQYDDLPQVVNTMTAYNVWPHVLNEVQLSDGQQAGAIMVTIGFIYDSQEEA